MDNNVTLVSAYYIFKSKFGHDKYESWIKNFMKIKSNKIIFVDERSKPIIQKYDTGNTKYIIKPIKDFLVSQYDEHWKYNKTIDLERNHTVELYKVWAEKTNFVTESIKLNPYNTDYFVWCDIGCFRFPNKMDKYIYFPQTKNMDKVTFLLIKDFTEAELQNLDKTDNRFQVPARNGGGIFGGHKDYMLKWHDIYYKTLNEFFEKKLFAGKDQCVYAFAILRNPDVCRFIKVPKGYNKKEEWFYLEEYFT